MKRTTTINATLGLIFLTINTAQAEIQNRECLSDLHCFEIVYAGGDSDSTTPDHGGERPNGGGKGGVTTKGGVSKGG